MIDVRRIRSDAAGVKAALARRHIDVGVIDEVASLDERAVRRVTELRTKGFDVCFSEIRSDIEERDQRDAWREVSPMRPAPDAVRIVTDELSVGEVVDRILELCAARGRED